MASQQLLVFVFIFGFVAGIFTLHLHNLTQDSSTEYAYEYEHNHNFDTDSVSVSVSNASIQRREDVKLDPFPLQPCAPNRTSAVYVFYGRPVRSNEGDSLFKSIKSLLKSNFPGRVRVIIDQRINETIREEIQMNHRDLLTKIDLHTVPLPDLDDKELIPHSNKIRALQAAALVYGTDSDECTVSLDTDTYVHHEAPWNNLLSILQLNDFAVAHDCDVQIAGVPDFLRYWMPNTGVLALRNTPRTRMVLKDWLDNFVPCNATHVSTCMPGTDQYPFLQLMAKHAVRFHKLDNSWNCRLAETERDAGIEDFPVYSLTVLSNREDPGMEGASIITTCAGYRECHILHGHWLKYS